MPSSPLDPTIVNVAKAIRTVESGDNFNIKGKSGEYGAYQFTEPTWNAQAAKLGISSPFNQATPEEQNAVAYHYIADLKGQGLNVGQIASTWNSGKADPTGLVGTNSAGVHFDTPKYVNDVYQAYVGFRDGTNPAPTPSVGGFLGNVVSSGANFLGNLGDAALHPVRTVQTLGSTAVGGLQELGGQQNDNTANFDALVNFYKDRYGGVDKLAHTAYTDPIGLAADLSAFLTGAGGALRLGARAGEAVGAVDAANVARTAAGVANRGADLTNPLTPLIAGGSKLLGKTGGLASEVTSQLTGLEPRTITDIIKNPQAFTADEIANTSRITVAKQVEDALQSRVSHLDETGSGYDAIRTPAAAPEGFANMANVARESDIPVSQNFLEEQLRSHAGVNIVDGKVVAKGSSIVRDAKDVRAVQNLLDTWKPEFQKGYLTPPEFLNLRTDLAKLAKFEREFSSSKPLEGVAASVRQGLNTEYRGAVPGLTELDSKFAAEKAALDELRKGILDKEGNIQDSAINKIANAVGKGKDQQLARLEQLVPGITQKLQILKSMEDIKKSAGTKVGTYPSAFLKAGGVLAGAVSGRVDIIAASIATMIIASPDVAVPLLRMFGNKKELVNGVLGHLARFTTIGSRESAIQSQPSMQEPATTAPEQSPAPSESPSTGISPSPQPTMTADELAKTKGFDITAARKSGYTDEEILAFLNQ